MQEKIAHDINGIQNFWIRYGVWTTYWVIHLYVWILKTCFTIVFGLSYALTIGRVMPQKKKGKKGH